MNQDYGTLSQYSLDKMNIEFLILQLSEMKTRGFEPNQVIIQRMYEWIKKNDEKLLEKNMRDGHLI